MSTGTKWWSHVAKKLKRHTTKHLNRYRALKEAERQAEREAEERLRRPLSGSKLINRMMEGCD